jgi:hypothetical protein
MLCGCSFMPHMMLQDTNSVSGKREVIGAIVNAVCAHKSVECQGFPVISRFVYIYLVIWTSYHGFLQYLQSSRKPHGVSNPNHPTEINGISPFFYEEHDVQTSSVHLICG